MRVLSSGEPLPFERLALSERNRAAAEGMIGSPHGLILAVGPTGSGKTTTLHALLRLVNTPERKVITAEDPVEITQPRMQQVQVHHQIGLDFARALRAFLRSDPDVILIGEMRDLETAHVCVEASLTGHLVFSTLHTNSAPETVSRLLDMGLDPFNFADAILGVVAQRLVRTLCTDCKEPYRPSASEIGYLERLYDPSLFPELGVDRDSLQLYRSTGCDLCGGCGYRGRVAIHEVLVGTNAMKELVAEKPRPKRVRELAMQEGMRTLLQDGIAKIIQGHTDLTQVRAVTVQ
jgi:type II secretory ATPase GspE/PulE/Tfp pilus assembly ATPase PilB-like protein